MSAVLNNIYREKLLNAILYFAKNVKFPSRTKIFKLLFFLDFGHFKQTGRPVTNQSYYAWDFGPAPKDLWLELKEARLPEDFRPHLNIEEYRIGDEKRQGFNFKPKHVADLTVFSPREKKLLENLAFIFKDAKPTEMSEISHLPNAPWDRTIREKGQGAVIDYLLALDKDALISEEDAKVLIKEREEMFRNFPIKPTLS